MTESQNNDTRPNGNNVERVETEVREAVEEGEDIRGEVERITRAMLTEGRVDTDTVRKVVEAVGKGAGAGAGVHGDKARHALAEALAGLDAAMAKHAENIKLSIEEALGRVEDFSQKEVTLALERLRGLESLMLDTLREVADAGRVAGAETLGSLVEHARRGGTTLGEEAEGALRTLASHLPKALQETALAGIGAARETAARLAETASGFLAGVSDALREKEEESTPSGKESEDRGS